MPRAGETPSEDCQVNETRRTGQTTASFTVVGLRWGTAEDGRFVYLSQGSTGRAAVGTALVRHPPRATDAQSLSSMRTLVAMVCLNDKSTQKN